MITLMLTMIVNIILARKQLIMMLMGASKSKVGFSWLKNGLRKLLRISYRRLKAGFFVCWRSTVCLFASERVLTETE